MKTIDSAVVAVAGLGTRLYPTSASVPRRCCRLAGFRFYITSWKSSRLLASDAFCS